MDFLLLTHVPWEGPGTIATAARRAGVRLWHLPAPQLDPETDLKDAFRRSKPWSPATRRHIQDRTDCEDPSVSGYDLESLRRPKVPDGVVVMGGPMGVYETRAHPWIEQELAVLKEAIDGGLAVLGVCLGAQLLAAAAGSSVYKGERPEIGFGWVKLTREGKAHPVLGASAGNADNLEVFHWHGDTFDLPRGATLLASSPLYENQAFSLGPTVLGLQFHLEVDEETLALWIPHLGDAAVAGADTLKRIEKTGKAVFDRYFAECAAELR